MTPYAKYLIAQKIRIKWSPEQIAGFFKKNKVMDISYQRIYEFIHQDKKESGCLYRHLRQGSKKKRGSMESRGQIKNRISIEKRPKIVDEKKRVGDCEADTIVSRKSKDVLVTIAERKSQFVVANLSSNKSCREVTEVVTTLLQEHKKHVHTITSDNGKEFAHHERIAKKLKTEFYFAHPHSSWERGLNEHINGLIRQYFPKKTDLGKVDQEMVSKSNRTT